MEPTPNPVNRGSNCYTPALECLSFSITYANYFWGTRPQISNCSFDIGEKIQPLFTANPILSHCLQHCLSLEFDPHRINTRHSAHQSGQSILRNVLPARIDVSIEPTKITDFMNLYTSGDQWDQDDLEGTLQLHHLTSTRSDIPIESISDTNMSIWKHTRKIADEDGDTHRCRPRSFMNNFKQAITCPIVLGEDALKLAGERNRSRAAGKETANP